MIYEQNCYNLNIKYFDNLIQVNIKNILNAIARFKIYENVLEIFKLNKCNMIISYFNKEFLIYNERDLKNVFLKIMKSCKYKYIIFSKFTINKIFLFFLFFQKIIYFFKIVFYFL